MIENSWLTEIEGLSIHPKRFAVQAPDAARQPLNSPGTRQLQLLVYPNSDVFHRGFS
jgi:hypothetical protein